MAVPAYLRQQTKAKFITVATKKARRTMNTSQEDSIRRARMEALADKQRSELPDVQAAALQAAIDAEDAETAAETKIALTKLKESISDE